MIERSGFVNSLWYESAAPAPATRPLDGATQADVVVVGAGFTGLSAALHLQRRGVKAVVLEAGDIGQGASGRNQGHCTPTFSRYRPSAIVEKLGPVWGPRFVALQSTAAELVFSLVRQYQMECEAVQNGFVQAAHLPSRLEVVKALADEYAAIGRPCRVLTKDETDYRTGSARYYGGWIVEDAGHVNPLGYVRGLARAAMQEGASVHTGSPVTSLTRVGTSWRAVTPNGTVTAEKVVLGTDAYTGKLNAAVRDSSFLMTAYNLTSDPLPEDIRRTLMPEGNHVADTRRDTQFYRLDTSGRFITGSIRSGQRGRDEALSRRKMAERIGWVFPQLKTMQWTRYWTGLLGMTPDLLPRLAEVAPGMLTGLGYSGRGVPTATAVGGVLANAAAGDAPAELALQIKPLHPLAARQFYAFAGPNSLHLHRLKDKIDTVREKVAAPYF